MFQITFNPGPSQISDATKSDMVQLIQERFMETSHRGEGFQKVSSYTLQEIRKFFQVPDDYHIYYTTSATEAMELIIRNLVVQKSYHFTNGSFSELFENVAHSLHKETVNNAVPWGEQHDFATCVIPSDAELIALTHNETSTGVMCLPEQIAAIHNKYPEQLLAVDITSLAGMAVMKISDADLWFFSVQKGFGLPSGLGLLFVSSRAFTRSLELEEQRQNMAGVFSFSAMQKFMDKNGETVCTPNLFDIYLLGKVAARFNEQGGMPYLEQVTRAKAERIYKYFSTHPLIRPFAKSVNHRSFSVLCFEAERELIASLHEACREREIILGKGYGKMKDDTFRIANFPAITEEHLDHLLETFSRVD